jgi:alginate production protein
VHVTLPAVRLEAAVSRGIFSGVDAVRDRRDELQLLASAVTRVSGAQLGVYTLARRDTTRNERPVWVGGTVDGRAGTDWSYWGDVAARRGTSATSRLAGWALDGGVRHRWNRRWSPTVTLGYAFGSGDRTRGDGLDTRFRQTDLEDNQAYFGGLRRVAIYGELFDPELSNLHVFTAGLGVRPRRGLAVDAVYHRFAQASATSSLPSSDLDGALNGVRRALGDELNLVLTLRAIPGVDLDLAAGTFVPGPAFAGSRTPAFFCRPQVRFSF